MSTIIDELVVELTLDGTFARNEADRIKRETEKAAKETGEEFKKTGEKAKEAGQKAKEGAKTAESSWTNLTKRIKENLMSFATGAMALYGIQSMFSNYLSQADSMGKMANAIGENISELHAWGEAATRAGGSTEGFLGSVKSLSTQLSKMSTTGKSRAGKILQEKGIDAGSIGRQRKSLDVLLDIADVMQTMSKEEAFSFGSSLGLDSGTIMLLQEGRDAVADLIQKQKELGVYTEEDAKATAEFNDAISDSKQAFMSFASVLFKSVMPLFKGVVQQFTDFVVFLRQHEVAVKAFFTMLSGVITYMLIPSFVNLAKAMWRSPLTWYLAGIALLAVAFEDFYGWANGKEALFGELWETVFEGPEGREDALAFIEDFKKSIEDLVKALKDLTDAQKGISTEHPLGEGFDNWLTQLQEEANKNSYSADDFWGYQFGDLGKWFENILHDIENDVQATLNDLAMDIDKFFNDLEQTASRAVNSVKGFFADLKNAIMNAINEAVNFALDRLADLAAAVKATPIVGSAIDFVTGGSGNTTNNTVSSKFDVVVNTRSTDAQGTGLAVGKALKRYSPAMANSGTRG